MEIQVTRNAPSLSFNVLSIVLKYFDGADTLDVLSKLCQNSVKLIKKFFLKHLFQAHIDDEALQKYSKDQVVERFRKI